MNNEELRDGAYGISPLSNKTGETNHFKMQLKKQHFALSHLKTVTVGPASAQTHYHPHGSSILNEFS